MNGAEIRIAVADESLAGLVTLLLSGAGYNICGRGGASLQSILIFGLDGADRLPEGRYRCVIGISRDGESVCEALKKKCRCVIHRPFEFETLLDAVADAAENAGRKTLRAAKKREQPALTLDSAGRCLICGDKKIGLTPNEFRLLELLLDNRGSPVSREALASVLGGGGSNKPEVYICGLRKKTEAAGGGGLIKTVRGKGYVI